MTKRGNKGKEKGLLPLILDVWTCSGVLYVGESLSPGIVGGLWCYRIPCQVYFTCWPTWAGGASGEEGKRLHTRGRSVNGLKEGGELLAGLRIRGLWAARQRPIQPEKQLIRCATRNWLWLDSLKVTPLTSLMNWRILLRWSPWTWITSPYSGWSITVPLQANFCWGLKRVSVTTLYTICQRHPMQDLECVESGKTYPFESFN